MRPVILRCVLLAINVVDTRQENHIVSENRLPGAPSTEWDVNGAGSDLIQGFTTRVSYLPGETVEVKVQVAEDFDVAVYRFGWYGGLGARLILKEEKNQATPQPECSHENEVIDCGNWRVSSRFQLPKNATSGLYAARLELKNTNENWREDGSKLKWDPHHHMEGRDPSLPPEKGMHSYGALGGKFDLRNPLKKPRASLAFFLVRSQDAHDLLFQTADTTWHAYNGYGGLTTYGSFTFPWTHLPEGRYMQENEILHRAYKRSYNTPLITRDYRSVNAPFAAEYAAIRFLERLGIDMHYASGADLGGSSQRASILLSQSKAYLSVGHDEYFSYEQRKALETARSQNGLHLFFWSGNEAYWAIRFEDSQYSTNQDDPPRTMVCYKETQSVVKLDPVPNAWTGTFRDARSINPRGPLPENALTGTMFAANAQRNDPMVIEPLRFGGHRLWAHTSVRAAFLEKRHKPIVFLSGILGHEWDEPIDNGFQPAFLQKVSATAIDNVQVIIDWGSVFDTGTATHSFVLFRHPTSNAITFGAGTVQFAWALDDTHDVNDPQRQNKYSIRITKDPRGACTDLQQLTVNLFADAGIRMPQLNISDSQKLILPQPSTDILPPAAVLDRAYISDGILRASGRAFDLGGGVVSSVEIAWPGSPSDQVRWFSATLSALDTAVTWTFSWNDRPWHALHGTIPKHDPAFNASIRVSDDSGNHAEFNNVNAAILTPRDPISHDEL